MLQLPISASEENQGTRPTLLPGGVPLINTASAIEEVIETYLASAELGKRTVRGYRVHIVAAMGKMCVEKLSDLEPIHLVNYRAEIMADGRTAGVHSKALIALRSFLTWGAALRGHAIPVDQFKYLLKVPKTKVITPHQILTDKEILAYLAAAKREGRREYTLILVALGSGLRVSELVYLDCSDILTDLAGVTIHVRQGKGSKDRLVPVRKEVGTGVETYLAATGRRLGDPGALFQSEDNAMGDRESWRLSTKTATRIIKECAEKAGIRKRVTPHALRHTFASATFMHSRNAVAVMKLLGHESMATTLRYIDHLIDSDLRNATPAYLVGAKGPRVSAKLSSTQ